MNSALEELNRRGFIKQCTNLQYLDEMMQRESIAFYCGFDPTASSLHAGHLVPLFAMGHLYRAGHKPIALVGGGTALIGDPTGRTEMRSIQTKDEIEANARSIQFQIEKFINFREGQSLLVNNADWLTKLNYIDFLRDIGRHFSVNRMLTFETYKARMETGLSFIEFNYQLLQSYDFLVLFQEHACKMQIGGDDQWGNIVAGADLIRRIEGTEAIGLTFPLVTRSDGKKMGKTEKGALFLDPEMTPTYEFFQYWRNVADADVEKFMKLYTFLPVEQIEELCSVPDSGINKAKEAFAFELTKIVHGEAEAQKALEAARGAFTSSGSDTSAIPSVSVPRADLERGIPVLDLFAMTELCSSKSDARRLVQQGGATVNDRKIEDIETTIDAEWISGDELLLRAGKKRYFKVVIE